MNRSEASKVKDNFGPQCDWHWQEGSLMGGNAHHTPPARGMAGRLKLG